jgi:hypothetical protein
MVSVRSDSSSDARATDDSKSMWWSPGAIYGSYHPRNTAFIDALLGYSALDFGSIRFVTPTSGMATGDRSGSQTFGSISSGHEYKSSRLLVSPYGRMEAAWTQLHASPKAALAGFVGMRAE